MKMIAIRIGAFLWAMMAGAIFVVLLDGSVAEHPEIVISWIMVGGNVIGGTLLSLGPRRWIQEILLS